MQGAWIEIPVAATAGNKIRSLPVQGAWIEIALEVKHEQHAGVAPRAGSVD